MSLGFRSVLLAATFASQIIVLSFYVPQRWRQYYALMFRRYPPEQYLRLYPLPEAGNRKKADLLQKSAIRNWVFRVPRPGDRARPIPKLESVCGIYELHPCHAARRGSLHCNALGDQDLESISWHATVERTVGGAAAVADHRFRFACLDNARACHADAGSGMRRGRLSELAEGASSCRSTDGLRCCLAWHHGLFLVLAARIQPTGSLHVRRRHFQ